MNYTVQYTERAKGDLRNLFGYIYGTLLEPGIAAKQARRIVEGIRSLEEFPLRYPLYEHEPWHSRGLRCFPIDRQLVFYFVDEEAASVFIMRILYGGRDIKKWLSC